MTAVARANYFIKVRVYLGLDFQHCLGLELQLSQGSDLHKVGVRKTWWQDGQLKALRDTGTKVPGVKGIERHWYQGTQC